jgi:hypothetical protein
MRHRLLSVRAALLQTCRDLDKQIHGLDQICTSFVPETPAEAAHPTLFDSPPAPDPLPPIERESTQPVFSSSLVLKATAQSSLDPELEQATLEELNEALSKAFAHISGQATWQGSRD